MQKPVRQLSSSALERFVLRAKRAAGLRGAVNVLVTGNRELKALNGRFRGRNYATDVLSFPPLLETDSFAGDIAVSSEIARENAKRFGHAAADEVRILVLHGVLHLAGHDHESDNGAMEAKERLLRKKLGLPTGLIERTLSGARLSIPTTRKARRDERAKATVAGRNRPQSRHQGPSAFGRREAR